MAERRFYKQLVDDYSLMLLNWAYKKLGNREQAEELVQEVWLQVFSAAADQTVREPEHFLWKIAHYVWLRHLRQHTTYQRYLPMDEPEFDFAQELAEAEEQRQQISYMRKRVMNLNALRREIMISFYIDRQPQREIANRLGISEAAVKWHLFDTRKKLKKEITSMKQTDFVYRPHHMYVGVCGSVGVDRDTNYISQSLTMQNICIACYRSPQKLDALADLLGIPKAYIESDVKWLLDREFLTETPEGYLTTFKISTPQDSQDIYAVHLKYKPRLADAIIAGLSEAEETIRSIGFYGSDRPMSELLWFLIYQFDSYQKWHSSFSRDPAPVRPDGGKYYPLGFDWTEPAVKTAVNTAGWNYNGPMVNQGFWWFGLYHFWGIEIQNLINAFSPAWQSLQELLCTIIRNRFDITGFDEEQKFKLSELVEKGFVRISEDGEKAYPSFCVFTADQYRQLEETVFAPLEQKLKGVYAELADELIALCREKMPPHLSHLESLFLDQALYDVGYLTTVFAFQENKLYDPPEGEKGDFLAMMYIIQ